MPKINHNVMGIYKIYNNKNFSPIILLNSNKNKSLVWEGTTKFLHSIDKVPLFLRLDGNSYYFYLEGIKKVKNQAIKENWIDYKTHKQVDLNVHQKQELVNLFAQKINLGNLEQKVVLLELKNLILSEENQELKLREEFIAKDNKKLKIISEDLKTKNTLNDNYVTVISQLNDSLFNKNDNLAQQYQDFTEKVFDLLSRHQTIKMNSNVLLKTKEILYEDIGVLYEKIEILMKEIDHLSSKNYDLMKEISVLDPNVSVPTQQEIEFSLQEKMAKFKEANKYFTMIKKFYDHSISGLVEAEKVLSSEDFEEFSKDLKDNYQENNETLFSQKLKNSFDQKVKDLSTQKIDEKLSKEEISKEELPKKEVKETYESNSTLETIEEELFEFDY